MTTGYIYDNIIATQKKEIEELKLKLDVATNQIEALKEQVSNLKFDLGIEREFRDR
jgi:hypothetical protein